MARLLSSEALIAAFGAGQVASPDAHAIALRPEQDADLPWLQDLYASTRRDELARVPWPDVAKRAFTQQQFALQRAHYRQHFADADFLIVQAQELPIGRLYLHRAARAAHTGGYQPAAGLALPRHRLAIDCAGAGMRPRCGMCLVVACAARQSRCATPVCAPWIRCRRQRPDASADALASARSPAQLSVLSWPRSTGRSIEHGLI